MNAFAQCLIFTTNCFFSGCM